MYLDNEKLQLSTIVFQLRRKSALKKKKLAEIKRTRKVINLVDRRLIDWLTDGKYKLNYKSIDDILKELDVTSEELSYYCATQFGKSFLTWRKELRIEDAKRLLLEYPEIPSYKIGQSLGITDKADFRHQFKSVTGVTPKEWREKYLKKNLRK
ncbi:MAG: AraC family transcriptional regulator [Bacteroidales bacterium]|nr:AraC family transcriptional regulator [Bacteroidales bacterium]